MLKKDKTMHTSSNRIQWISC